MTTSPSSTAHTLTRSEGQRNNDERDLIGATYRGLVESADEAMVVVNAGSDIVLVNSRAEQLFGYRRQELVGLNIDVLVPERFRDGHSARCDTYAAHPRLREMGSGLQLLGRRKDGTEFPAEISLSPWETTDGAFVASSIRDVSARSLTDYRASHFVAVVESSHDAIIGRDLAGLVTSWNPGAETLFGYTEDEMLGQPISVLDVPGQGDDWREQMFEGGERQDTVRARKDGTLINVSITNSPIRGADGVLRGRSTIARDISDRRRAEELKDGFLTLVSHELRTPLSAIVAYVELLLGDDVPMEHLGKFLEVIHRNSLRLERLVEDLLFVAQLESTGLTVTRSDVDIVAVAQEAVEAAMPHAQASGVDLRFDTASGSFAFMGDASRLSQALDNLISNAVKYSPDGGEVCVRVLAVATECIIEVQDHGLGIALEEQEHIFERFFRASEVVDLHIQGVGLGLMVVKSIVDAHGGQVSVESEPGRGTTFRMSLPLNSETRRLQPLSVPTLAA